MKFTAKIEGMINPRTTKPVSDISLTLKDQHGRVLYDYEKPLTFHTKKASKMEKVELIQSSLAPLMPSNYTLVFAKKQEKSTLIISFINCMHDIDQITVLNLKFKAISKNTIEVLLKKNTK